MKDNFTQRDYLLSLLRALSESFRPSGFEDTFRERAVKEVESAADPMWVDSMGNLFAYRSGKRGGASPVLTAHMVRSLALRGSEALRP
ncbi:MAG: hypothetical protein RXQ79_03575 [Acidilobus sp.]